jgi:hypothetical protein
MKNFDIIDVFLENIPSELIPKLSESENQSNLEDFKKMREFLFKDAAIEYFNIFLRKVLLKQIEMRESVNSEIPFHTDFIYPSTIMEKYLSCLDENDELVLRYKNADFSDWASKAKDYGIF